MSAYPLAMLIGVCKLREDSAASAMRAAEANLNQEQERERTLRADLAAYMEWRLREEDRRYEAFFAAESDRTGMEKFRADLATLKERELELEKEIIDSQRLQVELAAKLAETKKVYLAAVQESRKIDAHRESWLEEWNREQARAEDVEMEEFSKGKPAPEDEETVDEEELIYG